MGRYRDFLRRALFPFQGCGVTTRVTDCQRSSRRFALSVAGLKDPAPAEVTLRKSWYPAEAPEKEPPTNG